MRTILRAVPFASAVLFVVAVLEISFASHSFAQASNLLANASAESISGNQPASWNTDEWGGTKAIFSFPSVGAQDGSRYLQVQITKKGNGDAKWYPALVSVTPGQTYTFSEWYRSDVATGLDVQYKKNSRVTNYMHLADLPPASQWTNYRVTFMAPAGTKKLTVLHYISDVGTLLTDNYSLSEGTSTGGGSGTPTTTISIANAGAVPPQTIHANSTRQPLGGFSTQVTGAMLNDAVIVPGMNFFLSTSSSATGLFTNILITNESGVAVAGPIDASYDTSTGKQLLHFSDTVAIPWGSHTYTISGIVPATYASGAQINVSTNPSLNWSPAHTYDTNSSIALPNVAVQMNTMTVAN